MASKAKKRKNENRAQNVEKSSPFLLRGILATVGKPLFLTIYNILWFFLYTISLIGRFARRAPSIVSSLLSKIPPPAKKFRKKTIPVSTSSRIRELKIVLFFIKISSFFKSIKLRALKTPRRKRLLKLSIYIPLFLMTVSATLFYFAILKGLPSPNELSKREPEVSTKIYDRNGILLYKIYKDKNRTLVPLTEIPVHVRLATLAAEDAEFYDHPGFSIKGIARALTQDFKSDTLQGGSTITQQLVKNVLLSPEKTITRKIKEIILSIQVETKYTKDKILEMYLNEVSYGGTAYGIEEASLSFFGKEVKNLTIAEAAFLAGLPQSPTTYSPFGSNPDAAFERQREVLKLMRVNKFITPETENMARAEKLVFVPNKTEIKAPHFVMYIRQMLVDKYGEDMVEKGGLEVTTSLDMKIQETAEAVVAQEIEKLRPMNVGNGAALVVNPKTGEILAMVGSKNYFDTASDGQVNVLLRLRQPGSSIKLVNYAYALSNGYSPASIIDDSPITYSIPGSKPYSPVNYDGQYVGPVSLRSAFAQSRNIPAVKILASYGVGKMVNLGQKMGIDSWNDASDYGLSLTLGGGAVRGIELANVFSVVANEGMKPDMLPILTVRDFKGRKLEDNKPDSERVLDPRIAFMLTDILRDNAARAPEFGLNSYLVVKNHPEVAVKTGTSNDLRDNWTVGYNQDFLTLTWVGNNDNSPMSRVASGVTGASPIWNKIMTALLADREAVSWTPPIGLSKVNICPKTGTLPCNGCSVKQEWFLEENKPKFACRKTDDKENEEDKEKTKKQRPGRILESGISTEAP
jgi:1A family penicillin-binding protein